MRRLHALNMSAPGNCTNMAQSRSTISKWRRYRGQGQGGRDTAAEHLRLLGSSTDHPSGIVDITAPISGVITDQEVTNAAGVQSLGTSPFTISDLSTVWIVCDVYENDLSTVHTGDPAEITLIRVSGPGLQ